ncbi:hypothetical protein A4A49_59212, partial [Nicotiana attenuata]
NAAKSTISDNDTASPVQMVTGKDTSNQFMAVPLPKSEDEHSSRRRLPKTLTHGEALKGKGIISKKKKNEKIEDIIKQTLENFFQEKEKQETHMIKNPSLNLSPERSQSTGEDDNYEDENHLNYQDAQDPYEDDLGMSFDSIALHNLDT